MGKAETFTALCARSTVRSSTRLGNTPTTCQSKNGGYMTDDHK